MRFLTLLLSLLATNTMPKTLQRKAKTTNCKLISDSGAGKCLMGNSFVIVRRHKTSIQAIDAISGMGTYSLDICDGVMKAIIVGKLHVLQVNHGLDATAITG